MSKLWTTYMNLPEEQLVLVYVGPFLFHSAWYLNFLMLGQTAHRLSRFSYCPLSSCLSA